MAHLTSAPALRTAREIMKAYAMEVKPPQDVVSGRLDGLTNSERHVATLIDHSTNVHEVVKLRPEFHHWQNHLRMGVATAPQLVAFMSKVSAALALVPRSNDNEAPVVSTFRTYPEAKMQPDVRTLPKFALEAARVLFWYYRMTPVGRAVSDAFDRKHVAGIVEVTLGLSRILKVEGAFMRVRSDLIAGSISEISTAKFMRMAGVLFDRMPSYENREEEVMILA